jgi:hypothetical protein
LRGLFVCEDENSGEFLTWGAIRYSLGVAYSAAVAWKADLDPETRLQFANVTKSQVEWTSGENQFERNFIVGIDESSPKFPHQPPQGRESWKWVTALDAYVERITAVASSSKPWFVMDRGADFHGVLVRAFESGVTLTVRSAHERTIRKQSGLRRLWTTLRRQPVLGVVKINLPRAPYRQPREAHSEIRAILEETQIRAKPGQKVWARLGAYPRGRANSQWSKANRMDTFDYTSG